jgi:protein SCO1/2
MNRRTFFANLAATAAVPAAAVAASRVTSGGTTFGGIVRAAGEGRRNIPNVAVTSQEGKTYRFYNDLVKGKTVLINFFYAECTGICPRMTGNIARIQKALGDQVGRDTFIYSISLKPEQDTPKKLQAYAKMHGIHPGSGWLLLQASRTDMELLRERLGFKDSDPGLDADINQHTGILRFGNDVYDKWSGYPVLGNVELIAEMVRQLDPMAPRRPLLPYQY